MEITIHTPQQLAQALRGQRKARGLTQKTAGASVGLLPKTISSLEHTPERSSVGSLFKLLSTLELELVIRTKPRSDDTINSQEW